MTGSGKKVIKAIRRPYRERPQPEGRKRLGLLEKHKDYVQRARNYNAKQKTLKRLQEKARLRNPDEFYFKMEKSKLKDGQHKDDRTKNFPHEMIKVLKTQDQGYLELKRAQEAKKIERLKSSLHFVDGNLPGAADEGTARAPTPKHTVFVDTKEEEEKLDLAEHFKTDRSLVGRAFNRPRVDALDMFPVLDKQQAEKIDTARERAYKELESRLERADRLAEATKELETQRLIMGKGKRRQVGKDARGNPVYKWANKRQR